MIYKMNDLQPPQKLFKYIKHLGNEQIFSEKLVNFENDKLIPYMFVIDIEFQYFSIVIGCLQFCDAYFATVPNGFTYIHK